MEWIYLLTGLFVGALTGFLYGRLKQGDGTLGEKQAELSREHSALSERCRMLENEGGRLRDDLAEERALSRERDQELSRMRETAAVREQQLRQSGQQMQERERQFREQQEAYGHMQEQLTLQFQNIAGKLLEEKSRKFTELNKASLDTLLNPLRENIKSFEERVEKTYKAESDERNVLKGTVEQMMTLNRQLSEDTGNLTRALRGDTKKQGNWGEVILNRILERSGLVEGENYIIQGKNLKLESEEGHRRQPDVVVQLPGNKHIIIDAKVSLVAYERMIGSKTEEEREQHLKQHVRSVRDHITGLSAREYAGLHGIDSPDFVILFMPIESGFSAAVQHDTELFSDAWDQKIVVVGPSTLLATLLTIAATWRQEKQTRNTQTIARQAGALYDKFARFMEDLEKVGKHLGLTQKSYDDAFRKLHSGRGNILNRVEDLRKLGAKTTRHLNPDYLDTTEEPETTPKVEKHSNPAQ